MNITFSKPNPNPTFNPTTGKINRYMRVDAATASQEDIDSATSLRVVAPSEEMQAALELVEALGQKLEFAGEIKSGTWQDGNTWVTMGKNGSRNNAKAVLDRFGI